MVMLWSVLLIGCSRQEEELESCVEVRTNAALGQGVIVKISDDEVVVATANHILEDSDGEILIKFFNQSLVRASVIKQEPDYDVALLKFDPKELNAKTKKRIRSAHPSKFLLMEDPKEISVHSYEIDFDASSCKQVPGILDGPATFVYDWQGMLLIGNMKPSEGMSGGGIFDEAGDLLGIIISGSEDGSFAGVSYLDIDRIQKDKRK